MLLRFVRCILRTGVMCRNFNILVGIRRLAYCFIVLSFVVMGGMTTVFAGDNSRRFDNEHQSLLKIDHVGPGGETRFVKIGLNKSLVIELPRDVRDVLVSNPAFIDAVLHSSRRAYLIGKKVGEGNAFFFDKEGNRILTVEISISRDLTALEGILGRVLRDSKIKIDTVNDHIVLSGSVRNPSDSTKASDIAARFVTDKAHVINLLTTGGNEQVLLKVTVAEIKRTVAKKLGINMSAVASGSGLTLTNLANLEFPFVGSLIGAAIGNTTSLSYQNGADGVQGVLQALERNGALRTLAEPNLTAVSGETAKFLAGGEFPIPVSSDDDGVKIQFKPFGISLAFTPVVMDENRISLKIATEVSDISNKGAITLNSITIPAVEVRRASTTVELSSGSSIMMAGLISDDTKHNIDDVPELKRLPVLGALFRSRDFVRNESELVVIVTPYLVNGTARHKLSTPDQGHGVPSDRKAFLKGHLNKYEEHPKRLPWQSADRVNWSLKDGPRNEYKPSGYKKSRSRSWQRPSRRDDDGLGFIVE